MLNKLTLIALPIMLLNIGVLSAQEGGGNDETPFEPQIRTNQRAMGDQTFAITMGLYFPLFTVLTNDWPLYGYEAGTYKTKLSMGGTGGLAYSFYVSERIKVGLQVAGSFAKDINGNFAYSIPIDVKGSYEFHPWSRITIPLHLAVGIAMTSWKQDNFYVDPIIRPGFGVYFDWNFEWSFGMDTTWWFIPQIGVDDKSQRSIGNFMDLTLTAEYHF